METEPCCEELKDPAVEPTESAAGEAISDQDVLHQLPRGPAEESEGLRSEGPAVAESCAEESEPAAAKGPPQAERESARAECRERRKLKKTNSWKMVRFQDPSTDDEVLERDSLAESLFPEYALEEWTSATFEELFVAEDWKDVTEDRLLRKKVLESGNPQVPPPTWGQEVVVRMQCVMEDRTVVEKDSKLVFVIGEGDVNQALEECVMSMQTGEITLLLADSQYAYGLLGRTQGNDKPDNGIDPMRAIDSADRECLRTQGNDKPDNGIDPMRAIDSADRECVHVVSAYELCLGTGLQFQAEACDCVCDARDPDIPAWAPLLYQLQLLDVREKPDPLGLPVADRIRIGNQKRERGNFHYQREEYCLAARAYCMALDVLTTRSRDGSDGGAVTEEEEVRDYRVKCLNNLATAQLKLEQFDEALHTSRDVLSLEPNNVKALFRTGKLLSDRAEYREAMEVLKKALKLEPTTKAIHAELSKLVKRQSGGHETQEWKAKPAEMLGDNIAPFLIPSKKKPAGVSWKLILGALVVALGSLVTSVILTARN